MTDPGWAPMSFESGFTSWMVFVGLFGFATSLLWLVVGWRAMRAFERLARSIERHLVMSRTSSASDTSSDKDR